MKLEDFLKQKVESVKPHKIKWDKSFLVLKGIVLFPFTLVKSIKIDFTQKKYGQVFAHILLILMLFGIGLRFEKHYNLLPFNGRFKILEIIILIPIGSLLIFIPLIIFLALYVPERKFIKKLLNKHHWKETGKISFKKEEYEKAAEVLRKLEPITYNEAVIKYGETPWEILILASAVFLNKGKWKISLSIKAIEEDTEAGWEK